MTTTAKESLNPPTTYNADLANLPEVLYPLKSIDAWVAWKWVLKGERWTKPPFRPDARLAKTDDPATWSTHAAVIAAYKNGGGFSGIGFAIGPDSQFGFIDLDHCRDQESGKIHPAAMRVVAELNSYTEVSPSGTGLRIIGRATGSELHKKFPIPDGGGASVELYRRTNRYATITGNRVEGTVDRLGDIDAAMDRLRAKFERAKTGGTFTAGKKSKVNGDGNIARIVADGDLERFGGDRSRALFALIAESIRQGTEAEDIRHLVLSLPSDHPIAQHVADQGGDPRAYVCRQIERAKEKIGKEADKADARVEGINREYALVLAGDKSAIMRFEGSDFRLLKTSAFREWFKNKPSVRVGDRSIPIADYWLSHPNRREYAGIEFAPAGERPGYYNLWRGFALEAREGDCSLLLNHLWVNVAQGDGRLFDWIVGWFAHMFQNPTSKSGTSLVLRGGMGVGKTIVGKIFGSLLGPHYASVSDPQFVTGQFNAHMKQVLLLHADEAFWAGDKRAEGRLKDLVTGDEHFIEFKGIDPIKMKNYVRLFVTGNPDWQVPAGFGERRFAVVDVGEAHKEDRGYFEALAKQLEQGGREALLWHLLHFDLSRVRRARHPQDQGAARTADRDYGRRAVLVVRDAAKWRAAVSGEGRTVRLLHLGAVRPLQRSRPAGGCQPEVDGGEGRYVPTQARSRPEDAGRRRTAGAPTRSRRSSSAERRLPRPSATTSTGEPTGSGGGTTCRSEPLEGREGLSANDLGRYPCLRSLEISCLSVTS